MTTELELTSLPDARVQLRVSPERFHLSARLQPPNLRIVAHAVLLGVVLTMGRFALTLTQMSTGVVVLGLIFAVLALFLANRSLLPYFQRTTIDLGPNGGTISTRPLGRTRQLRLAELGVRRGYYPDFKGAVDDEGRLETAVVLDHGRHSFPFLIAFREAEQRHVVEALHTWLETAKRGAS